MLIESIIRRNRGTVVELRDGSVYHFKPSVPGGAHVCEVDADHVDVFLAVPEGFRVSGGKEPAGAETPNAPQVLQGDGGVGEAGEVEASPAAPRKRGRKPRVVDA